MNPAGRAARRPLWLLFLLWFGYLTMVVYVSLAPFGPWSTGNRAEWGFLLAPLPRYITSFDVLINVFAYLPLGWLAAAMLQRCLPGVLAVLGATVLGLLLSLAMEVLQGMLPPRIPSNLDLLTNGLGSLIGALPWSLPRLTRRGLQPFERARSRLLLPGSGAEVGGLLLVLWAACHLNPSIPFLGAGVVRNLDALRWFEAAPDPVEWALQAFAATLNATGIGLFLFCLLRRPVVGLGAALLLLLAVMGAKATMAAFLLKPMLVHEWLDSATLAGLALAALLLVIGQWLPRGGQVLAAGGFLLAGGLLAKLPGNYPPLSALRPLFAGNFGQLRSFTGLTVWLNETWPLLALLFLVLWWPRVAQVSSEP